MLVRMSKMDSLLIYTQRREKRTVTMKLRSCDLSIIFSWQPHIQLPGCSQNPPPPQSVGVFIQFTSIWRRNSLIWWASPPKTSLGKRSINLWLWWTYCRKESFQHDSAFPDIHAHKHTSLTPYSRLIERMTHLDAFCFPPSSDKPPSLIVNVLSVDLK